MKLIPVKVDCHAGYKADEYPVCFYLDEFRFGITGIVDRWYQANRDPEFPEANYFKVTTSDEKQFILKHEQQNDSWFLVVYAETLNL